MNRRRISHEDPRSVVFRGWEGRCLFGGDRAIDGVLVLEVVGVGNAVGGAVGRQVLSDVAGQLCLEECHQQVGPAGLHVLVVVPG